MRIGIVASLVGAGLLLGTTALADGPTTFGKSGQLAVSWDQPLGSAVFASNTTVLPPLSINPLGFQYTTVSGGGGSGTYFDLAPAADYFVIDNLSVGAQLFLGLGSVSPPNGGQGSSTTAYGIAPQVGYNLGLTDNITFWPKVFFGYVGSSTSNNGPSSSAGSLGIYAPFLFHPVAHFYLGIGPNFSTELFANASPGGGAASQSVSAKPTSFGVMATFGGWFLGD